MADVHDVRTETQARRNFDTDPRNRSAAEIEREVDVERARVAETLDALQEKASVGNVIDQVARAVGPYGADIGRNFGQQVRDNPLPLVLTGIGLAWLMMGSGPKRRDRDWEDRYWEDEDRDFVREEDPDYYGYRPAAASATPVYPEGNWETDSEGEATSGPGMGERMRRAREGVSDTASGLAGAAGRATGAVRGAGSSALRSAGGAGRDAYRRAASGGRSLQDGFGRMLEEQPLVAGALAFAVGAALGSVMPRSRTEDELFGQQSDRVKGTVRDAAAEQGRKLTETAGAVADEASRIVEEKTAQSSTPTSGEVGEAGQRIGERAQDEAERQNLGQAKPQI